MIRDEMRDAVRALDLATDRLVRVLEHAEGFVRGERRPPRITTTARQPDTRLTTPAPTGGFTAIHE